MSLIRKMRRAEKIVTGAYPGQTLVRTENANAVIFDNPATKTTIRINYIPLRVVVTTDGQADLDETGRINGLFDEAFGLVG